MASLLPHQHRSTSDRLLNNYLSSQKQLSTSLLTLLSHSHSSSSSLLAYVTSSPGVLFPVRRAVQYAAFEGPGSATDGADGSSGKWNEYIQSLESFRTDLKQVHALEEELSQVKRDREILVSRLIKATKAKPSKKDILKGTSARGTSDAGTGTGNGSVLSFRSDDSERTSGGSSKRQSKLAEAQAEVLGCEEHLRGLEVRLEEERSKVMKHGLMERFKAMEDVGRMWQRQARLGIAELQRADGPDGPLLPPNAYELDSNGSIAPSQSASQIGYGSDGEERAAGRNVASRASRRVAPISGSVTGSIAEEDETQTSGSEDEGNLVVHENARAAGGAVPPPARSAATTTAQNGSAKRFSAGTGHGVPSITDFRNLQRRDSASSDGSSDRGAAGGRRTQSEVGLGYNPPRNRHAFKRGHSLRRTISGGAASDGSSVRSLRGNGKKKGGFFKSLAKLFKAKPAGETSSTRGAPRRGGADSPPLTSRNTSGWTTRTDTNLRSRGGVAAAAADSSDDEDTMARGPMMSVTKNRNNTWSVDKVGLAPPAAKPTKTKKSRSDLGAGKGRSNSQSTITPATTSGKVVSKPPGVVRSNTLNSVSAAAATAAGDKRLRQGSITRTRAGGSNVGAPSIGSVLDRTQQPPAQPKLMEVPKAPKSQVTPQMYTVTAPPPPSQSLLASPPPLSGSTSASHGFGDANKRLSTVSAASTAGKSVKSTTSSNATAIPRSTTTALDSLGLGPPVSGAADSHQGGRSQTPLPPSKTLSPPAKSAMRASSPVPHSQGLPSSSLQQQPPPPPPAFMVTAPGPVVLDQPVEEKPRVAPVERAPTPTFTDSESVYESAVEDEGDQGTDDEAPTPTPAGRQGGPPSDAGTEDSDDTAMLERYKVVENAKASGGHMVPIEDFHNEEPPAAAPAAATTTLQVPGQTSKGEDYVLPSPVSVTESTLERRKSVRMNVPDSPSPASTPRRETPANGWSSRVGHAVDSSDEDESAAYVKAKKGLARYASLGAGSPGKTPKKKKSAGKVRG